MSEQKTYNCLSDRMRIEDIYEVCALFPEKNKLNDLDRNFLKSISKQKFISKGQNDIMNKIERKIFGIERDLEKAFNVLR